VLQLSGTAVAGGRGAGWRSWRGEPGSVDQHRPERTSRAWRFCVGSCSGCCLPLHNVRPCWQPGLTRLSSRGQPLLARTRCCILPAGCHCCRCFHASAQLSSASVGDRHLPLLDCQTALQPEGPVMLEPSVFQLLTWTSSGRCSRDDADCWGV